MRWLVAKLVPSAVMSALKAELMAMSGHWLGSKALVSISGYLPRYRARTPAGRESRGNSPLDFERPYAETRCVQQELQGLEREFDLARGDRSRRERRAKERCDAFRKVKIRVDGRAAIDQLDNVGDRQPADQLDEGAGMGWRKALRFARSSDGAYQRLAQPANEISKRHGGDPQPPVFDATTGAAGLGTN